ncbi:transposable element Tcb2 transposase [Trichonephila clavipes]|nr:transposable element Tcb2 transposase [Trichonephila clavipes]
MHECRFSLSSDCRRQLNWRENGTAYRPENIQEKDRYPTCSIMVSTDEVLLPHVRLFRGAVGDKFVFMDDNATCHRTLAVLDYLDSEGIQRLVWPARSSDLNPIENVWDALGRQVAGRNYPPTNKNTLIRALTEEWDKLPQQLLDNVVQKYPQRKNPELTSPMDGLFKGLLCKAVSTTATFVFIMSTLPDRFLSATDLVSGVTGAWMHIDENGDVEGNYTVLALQNAPQNLTLKGLGGEKNLSHLMLPIARFQYDGETGESVR